MSINSVTKNTQVANTNDQQAKVWQLTENEWNHYLELMKGRAGQYYPHLTPPEVLAMYAESEEELHHFAEIHVKLEHDKVAREVRFDRVFHDIAMLLYKDEPIIKPFAMSAYTPIPNRDLKPHYFLQAGDHLLLFVDIMDSTGSFVARVMDRVQSKPGVVLDIYCVNARDDAAIRAWAKENHVPVDSVSRNQITLNKDHGKFRRSMGNADLPYVMLVRAGKSIAVDKNAI